MSVVGVI